MDNKYKTDQEWHDEDVRNEVVGDLAMVVFQVLCWLGGFALVAAFLDGKG